MPPVTLQVTVTPNARENSVEQISKLEFKVKVSAAPEKGKANQMTLKLLSKHLGVSKGQLILSRGETRRKKIIILNSND